MRATYKNLDTVAHAAGFAAGKQKEGIYLTHVRAGVAPLPVALFATSAGWTLAGVIAWLETKPEGFPSTTKEACEHFQRAIIPLTGDATPASNLPAIVYDETAELDSASDADDSPVQPVAAPASNLKVYGWTGNHGGKQVRCICAAKSKAAVQRLAGVPTLKWLFNLCETGNAFELATARANPDVILYGDNLHSVKEFSPVKPVYTPPVAEPVQPTPAPAPAQIVAPASVSGIDTEPGRYPESCRIGQGVRDTFHEAYFSLRTMKGEFGREVLPHLILTAMDAIMKDDMARLARVAEGALMQGLARATYYRGVIAGFRALDALDANAEQVAVFQSLIAAFERAVILVKHYCPDSPPNRSGD